MIEDDQQSLGSQTEISPSFPITDEEKILVMNARNQPKTKWGATGPGRYEQQDHSQTQYVQQAASNTTQVQASNTQYAQPTTSNRQYTYRGRGKFRGAFRDNNRGQGRGRGKVGRGQRFDNLTTYYGYK